MTLQVFIDDSGSGGQPPVLVLGGYIASAKQWAAFADCWQRMLNTPPRPAYFKMNEAMRLRGQFRWWREEARDEWLRYVWDAICKHVTAAVGVRLPYDAFANTFGGASDIPREFRSPYFYAFFGLIYVLINQQHRLGLQEKMDFIFDEQVMEKDKITAAWDHFAQTAPIKRQFLGSRPIFRDDKEFLPLQAADFCAWMYRFRWMEEAAGTPPLKMPFAAPDKSHLMLRHDWTEPQLRGHLARIRGGDLEPPDELGEAREGEG